MDPATKLPVVPVSFVYSILSFRRSAPAFLSARGANRDLPSLLGAPASHFVGIRKLRQLIPFRFLLAPGKEVPSPLNIEVSGDRAGMMKRLAENYLDPDGAIIGGHLLDRLDALLIAGTYRTAPLKSVQVLYYAPDFLDGFSWASPSEKSFRQGAGFFEELYDEWKRLHGRAFKPSWKPDMGAAVASAVAIKERENLERHAEGDRRKRESHSPASGNVVLRRAEGQYTERKATEFLFCPDPKRVPPPSDRKAFLYNIPEALLKGAVERARNWADMLLEERTAYRRVIYGTPHPRVPGASEPRSGFNEAWEEKGLSQGRFEEWYAEAEKEVYQNRLAFEAGILTPLLPEGFRILF